MQIHRTTLNDLDAVTALFDAYRIFYRKTSELQAARGFLQARLQNQEAVIFLATVEDTPAGFTLLYPLYSSVNMGKLWLLNDLYVDPNFRQQGIGAALLTQARDFGKASGAVRLELATEITNTTAQSVYEGLGWIRDDQFYHYYLPLT